MLCVINWNAVLELNEIKTAIKYVAMEFAAEILKDTQV